MNISVDQLIGSLIYRTNEELRKDPVFTEQVKHYCPASVVSAKAPFRLSHYSGTRSDIKKNIPCFKENKVQPDIIVPTVLNIQPVKQYKEGYTTTVSYYLVLLIPVCWEWLTERSERVIFEQILRPVYMEFIDQLINSSFYRLSPGTYPPHAYYEIYNTGENGGFLFEYYGNAMEAIEIHELQLVLKESYSAEETELIFWESEQVKYPNPLP